METIKLTIIFSALKSKFIIRNSVSARKAQGCVYREGRVVREDEALYSLSVQGTVEDSALVKMAGQSVQSGSGAGVPISGEFSDIAAGVYEVYVKHTNIAQPLWRMLYRNIDNLFPLN